MGSGSSQPPEVLDRLLAAINAHELEAMVSCFAEDYTNETPVHPPRGFRGQEQVRANWSQIFAAVPNIHARVVRSSVDGDHRIAERRGRKVGVVATARKLLTLVYYGLRDGEVRCLAGGGG